MLSKAYKSFWSKINLNLVLYPTVLASRLVMWTLKHPSASVNPESQPSLSDMLTGLSELRFCIVIDLDCKNLIHLSSCSILCFKNKFPLKRWANIVKEVKSDTIKR